MIIREKRELLVGQTWMGNNRKCQNLGGSKEILALSIVKGRPNESRVTFRDQHGRKTWSTRASFASWISGYAAYVYSYVAPEKGPSVIITQFGDGWQASIEDGVSIKAEGNSPVAAFDGALDQLESARKEVEVIGRVRG